MPTRRFKYRSFLNLNVNDVNINENILNNLYDLSKLPSNYLENLPLTTTFNMVQFGNAATRNTTGTINDDSVNIPVSSTVFNKLSALNTRYNRLIQQYQIPEFMLILPVCPILVNVIPNYITAELYATSTGPRGKYLKSMTCKLVYNSSSTEGEAKITFSRFKNSKFYTVEQLSTVTVSSRTILTFKITENFPNINLKKSYTDLHLCMIEFNFISTTKHNPVIIETIQITELIDGDNINYLTSIANEDIDRIDYTPDNVKVAYIKSYNNKIRVNNGQIGALEYIKRSTLTTGPYGWGVNVIGVDPTTKEIKLSTT